MSPRKRVLLSEQFCSSSKLRRGFVAITLRPTRQLGALKSNRLRPPMTTAFAEARKAAERARRAAKKAKAVDSATSAASTDGTAAVASVATAVAVVWEPVELFDQPRISEETVQLECDSSLPGKLYEHVQVTPNGRRSHHIKHTSPGGTMREQHYASPAGVPQLHHENDDGWPAWRLSIAADRRKVRSERETAEKADKDARCPWRYVQYGRCTSRGQRRQPGCRGCTRKGVQACLVCEFALTQLNYTELERRIISGHEMEWSCDCGKKRCREQAREPMRAYCPAPPYNT